MPLAVFAFTLVLCIAMLGWTLLPRTRQRAAERAAEKFAKAAQVDPGPDWPVLYRRLQARGIGANAGIAITFPIGAALVPLLGDDQLMVWNIAAVTMIPVIGGVLGHLWSVRWHLAAPRVAELRARRLSDYLIPAERRLFRVAPAVPLLAAGVGVAAALHVPRDPMGVFVVGASVASLVVGLMSVPLCRRVLASPTGMTSEGGVVWAEMLRATTLREVAATSWTVSALAPAMAVFAALLRFDRPDAWWVPGCVLVIVLAGMLFIAIAWVGYGDSHHDWARQHLKVAASR